MYQNGGKVNGRPKTGFALALENFEPHMSPVKYTTRIPDADLVDGVGQQNATATDTCSGKVSTGLAGHQGHGTGTSALPHDDSSVFCLLTGVFFFC